MTFSRWLSLSSDEGKLHFDPDWLELLHIEQNIRPGNPGNTAFPAQSSILYRPIGFDLKLAGPFFIAQVTKFR